LRLFRICFLDLFFSLPDNPEEPAESLVPKASNSDQLKHIPLIRPGMNVSQPLTLLPSGPSPVQLPTQAQPSMNVVPSHFGMDGHGSSGPPGQSEREPNGRLSTAPKSGPQTPAAQTDRPELTVDFLARLLKSQSESRNEAPLIGKTFLKLAVLLQPYCPGRCPAF
jgi:hypothetical protein